MRHAQLGPDAVVEQVRRVVPFAGVHRPVGARQPAGDLDVILVADLRDFFTEQADDMGRIERRCDRHHGVHLGDAVCGGEHRGAAETVANQDGGRRKRAAQVIGRGDQVIDVG